MIKAIVSSQLGHLEPLEIRLTYEDLLLVMMTRLENL